MTTRERDANGGRDERRASNGGGGVTPSVRRRAVLKGIGGGAVATGLAGCPTNGGGGGGTDDPGSGTETESPGGGDGTRTGTKCFEKRVDCPDPCAGECVLGVEFTYDYEEADDGTKSVTRFRLEFVHESTEDDDCEARLGGGTGTFQFTVDGDTCSLDREGVFECECGTTVEFDDPNPDDGEDCICPDWDQQPRPECGEPIWIERSADFESITIDFEQNGSCGCEFQANSATISVEIRFDGDEISFGGDTADC